MEFNIKIPYTDILSLSDNDVCFLSRSDATIDVPLNKYNFSYFVELILRVSTVSPKSFNLGINCTDDFFYRTLDQLYLNHKNYDTKESITICKHIQDIPRNLPTDLDSTLVIPPKIYNIIYRHTHDTNIGVQLQLLEFYKEAKKLIKPNHVPDLRIYPDVLSFASKYLSINVDSINFANINDKNWSKFVEVFNRFNLYNSKKDNLEYIKSAIFSIANQQSLGLPIVSTKKVRQEILDLHPNIVIAIKFYIMYLYSSIFKDEAIYPYGSSVTLPHNSYYDPIVPISNNVKQSILRSIKTPLFMEDKSVNLSIKLKGIDLIFNKVTIHSSLYFLEDSIKSLDILHKVVNPIFQKKYFSTLSKIKKIIDISDRIDKISLTNDIAKKCISFLDSTPISQLKNTRCGTIYGNISASYTSFTSNITEAYSRFKACSEFTNTDFSRNRSNIDIIYSIISMLPYSFIDYYKELPYKVAILNDYLLKAMIVIRYIGGTSYLESFLSSKENYLSRNIISNYEDCRIVHKSVSFDIDKKIYDYIYNQVNQNNFIDYLNNPYLSVTDYSHTRPVATPTVTRDTIIKYNKIAVKLP